MTIKYIGTKKGPPAGSKGPPAGSKGEANACMNDIKGYYRACVMCGTLLDKRASAIPLHQCTDLPNAAKLWLEDELAPIPSESQASDGMTPVELVWAQRCTIESWINYCTNKRQVNAAWVGPAQVEAMSRFRDSGISFRVEVKIGAVTFYVFEKDSREKVETIVGAAIEASRMLENATS